jgi:mono/diheme cytochrome c family protein
MKNTILIASVVIASVAACKKKTTTTTPTPSTGTKVTYNADVKSIIDANCVSCHGASSKDGAYYNYATIKASVGTIISDINSGNMPKGASKLAQTSIDKVKQWQADGLLEQ